MQSIIVRKSTPATIKVVETVFSSPTAAEARTDILAEIIRRTLGWRRERLGVGLPPRR